MFKCYKCQTFKEKEEFYVKDNFRGIDDYCKECRKAVSNAYNTRNRARAIFNLKKWRKENPEKAKELDKHNDYRRSRRAIHNHRRRARLAEVEFDNTVNLERLFERDKGICGICKEATVTKENWSIDHIKPISKGGSHTWGNVQLAHHVCNSRKGADEGFRPEVD